MSSSIEDVAQRAGVSIATVSRTFKHPELVATKTRDRVLNVAGKLDFSISRTASAFQAGRTFRVALLARDRPSTWFNSHIYDGLNAVLQPAGYDIAFYQINNVRERREFFANLPIRRNVDAVVVTSFDIDQAEVVRLNSMNVPVAGINALPQDAFAISTSVDDKEAMYLMTRHLIALGHRSLAFARMSSAPEPAQHNLGNDAEMLHFSASLRAEGFIQACSEAGINPMLINAHDGEHTIDDVLTQLFALGHMPTAICCTQDSIAVPLMSRLQGFGLRIPENLSITGFDDIDFAAQTGLTTVRQDPVAMGRRTAELILEAIADTGKTAEPVQETLPTQLIFRASTAPLH